MALQWKTLDRIVRAHRLTDATADVKALRRELELWWCIKYTRPFKDPLLQTYTLDELVYEYLTHYYLDPNNDPANAQQALEQTKADEEWVKKMMAEMNGQQKIESKPQPPTPPQPDLPLPPEISTKFDG